MSIWVDPKTGFGHRIGSSKYYDVGFKDLRTMKNGKIWNPFTEKYVLRGGDAYYKYDLGELYQRAKKALIPIRRKYFSASPKKVCKPSKNPKIAIDADGLRLTLRYDNGSVVRYRTSDFVRYLTKHKNIYNCNYFGWEFFDRIRDIIRPRLRALMKKTLLVGKAKRDSVSEKHSKKSPRKSSEKGVDLLRKSAKELRRAKKMIEKYSAKKPTGDQGGWGTEWGKGVKSTDGDQGGWNTEWGTQKDKGSVAQPTQSTQPTQPAQPLDEEMVYPPRIDPNIYLKEYMDILRNVGVCSQDDLNAYKSRGGSDDKVIEAADIVLKHGTVTPCESKYLLD